MSKILPPIPRFVFTIFEPLSLFAGLLVPLYDIQDFANAQIPITPLDTPLTPIDRVLALQLCNLYGLLGMIGVGVLYWTTEVRVVRNFLIACAIADIGHIWATYAVIGHDTFIDVQNWNKLAWGNIGVTALLFVTRILYLAGVLGRDRTPLAVAGSKKTS